jgi:hypothetical protein
MRGGARATIAGRVCGGMGTSGCPLTEACTAGVKMAVQQRSNVAMHNLPAVASGEYICSEAADDINTKLPKKLVLWSSFIQHVVLRILWQVRACRAWMLMLS